MWRKKTHATAKIWGMTSLTVGLPPLAIRAIENRSSSLLVNRHHRAQAFWQEGERRRQVCEIEHQLAERARLGRSNWLAGASGRAVRAAFDRLAVSREQVPPSFREE